MDHILFPHSKIRDCLSSKPLSSPRMSAILLLTPGVCESRGHPRAVRHHLGPGPRGSFLRWLRFALLPGHTQTCGAAGGHMSWESSLCPFSSLHFRTSVILTLEKTGGLLGGEQPGAWASHSHPSSALADSGQVTHPCKSRFPYLKHGNNNIYLVVFLWVVMK